MATTESKWPQMKQCRVGYLRESVKGCNHFHYLSDELLMEILRRLPNCKSVVLCKCVCKRWATLASNPWFISQFINLRCGDGVPYGIVMWYKPNRYRSLWDGSESFFKPSIFDTRDSSFSPFHGLGDVNASAKLVASCNDLVLYSRHEKGKKYDLYISNVQTREWVELPSPPYHYCSILQFGLICDPFCSYDGREITLNAPYRYSVVVIHCLGRPSYKWTAHVFSSTVHGGRQWCERVLSLPKMCRSTGPETAVSFDEKLYFPCFEGIVGFDQNNIEFDNEIQCHLVKWPKGMAIGPQCVGVSQGNLKLSDLGDKAKLRVWVLKDYKTSNWMLQYEVRTQDWVSHESWMTKRLQTFSQLFMPLVDVLGFHSSNSDVIYMLVPGCIFLCNLSTRTLELGCRIPVAVAKGPVGVARSSMCYLHRPSHFLVTLPSWPTPLPRL